MVQAGSLVDADVLGLLRLEGWKHIFRSSDPLKKVRLLGGFAMRIMKVPQLLHWELRQCVEAQLGFVLYNVLVDTLQIRELP